MAKEIRQKYSIYDDAYDYSISSDISRFDGRYTPQLLDALFTGCDLPIQKHTYPVYTKEIEEDIKAMVIESPELLLCKCHLRCRDNVTPLYAACINNKIPIHMIEFLLEHGANPDINILLNNYREISLIADLKDNISEDRYLQIMELFSIYGLTTVNPAR